MPRTFTRIIDRPAPPAIQRERAIRNILAIIQAPAMEREEIDIRLGDILAAIRAGWKI